jgi:hypothetical protein
MKLAGQLKADPLNYVARLESPIGVYLRREVFKKENRGDATLKKKLHDNIAASQLPDGSWEHMFVYTANNLWNLALLGYNREDENVRRGLEWLLSIQRSLYRGYPGFFMSGNRKDASTMRSILYGEFGPGCTIFYQTAYAVHLFHVFGFDDNKRVQTTVNSYLQFWRPTWCSAWCTINVLRMLIEHPLSGKSPQVEAGIKHLARRQTRTGAWKAFPFYHTLHALSRSEDPLAEKQVKKALASAAKKQDKDGSWGMREKETMTYLVLDAMRNAGTL